MKGGGLTPIDIVKFTSAFVTFIRRTARRDRCRIVVGRDARVSGPMVRDIVVGTATGMGCDVIDLGLATTPTTEIAVTGEHADGGIIITASHNPVIQSMTAIMISMSNLWPASHWSMPMPSGRQDSG